MGINYKNIYYQSKKEKEDKKLKEKIEEVFLSHPSYGHRRLSIYLKVNKKRILRVMRKFNLSPPRLWYQKKFTTNSYSSSSSFSYTNLLREIDEKTFNIGDLWSSDINYIKFQGKFLYLAIIQDIISKEVVGFNLSNKHNSNLILKTLKEAVLKTGRFPVIFHSDRGGEYLSQETITFLKENKVQISISDKASPWQNAYSESFFSRLKTESGDLNRFESLGELIEYLYSYINYYNKVRIHSKLKMSPYQFKNKLLNSCS